MHSSPSPTHLDRLKHTDHHPLGPVYLVCQGLVWLNLGRDEVPRGESRALLLVLYVPVRSLAYLALRKATG